MDEKIVLTVDQAMQLAIEEARKGASFVSPNPLVGCVVLDENNYLLAKGFHYRYGSDHAEVDAIKKISQEKLNQATVIVTLEPCAHEGKTPSCAKMLAKLPIKKLIYGLQDPNPLVSGQGHDILKNAGINVEKYEGILSSYLEELCEIFLKNFRSKKIFISAKVASTLDGFIASKSNDGDKWITNVESREYVHELRSYHDAIVVGRNTIETDNPKLNIRHPNIKKEIKLIILDPSSKLLMQVLDKKEFDFLNSHKPENIFFATKNKIPNTNFQQIEFSTLESLNFKLWELGVRSLFIEGGAITYSAYFQENLIDRLYLFIAPTLFGQANGVSWLSKIEKMINIKNIKLKQFSSDIFITGRIR